MKEVVEKWPCGCVLREGSKEWGWSRGTPHTFLP